MFLIVMAVVGMVAIYLVASLLEWALFRRVVDSALVGMSLSVAAAVALAVLLYGFGIADDGAWNPLPAGVALAVAGGIVWALKLASHRRRAASAHSERDLGEIFK